jgi:hypothetical protein
MIITDIGNKAINFVMVIIMIAFITILLMRVIPLMPVPADFLPFWLIFLLLLIFFMLFAAYKSI